MVDVLLLTDFDGKLGFIRPAGAYRIATSLRRAGYRVLVVHCVSSFTTAELTRIVERHVSNKTKAVMFSTTFMNVERRRLKRPHHDDTGTVSLDPEKYVVALTVARRINPAIRVISGGVNFIPPELGLKIDTHIESFGDVAVVSLLAGESWFPSKSIKGVPIMDGERYPVDMSTIDIEYHDTDFIEDDETLTLEIARGCIFNCGFCASAVRGKSKQDYIKPFDVLRQELTRNFQMYKITRYAISDDTLNDSPVKVKHLYEQVFSQLPFNVEFVCYLRHDLLEAHHEEIDYLYRCGLRAAHFGIETTIPASAKAIGKGLSKEKTFAYLRHIRKTYPDILMGSLFIYGLPFDSLSQLEDQFQFLNSQENPLHAFRAWPLSLVQRMGKWSSEFSRNPSNHGYVVADNSWINIRNGLSLEQVQRLAIDHSRVFESKITDFPFDAITRRSNEHPHQGRMLPIRLIDRLQDRSLLDDKIARYKKGVLSL